ncbi:MAG: hypothetical protein GX330_03330, partial [Bacteroidales bacterium]|nr:hypothetical protein [Bacteroidales bacterium]
SQAQAQEPLVKWGEPVSNPDPLTRIHEFLQTEEAGFYAWRKTGIGNPIPNMFYLGKYDDSYKLIYSKRIPLSNELIGGELVFRNVLPFKNKIVAFYSGYKKDTKESYFVARNILPNGEVENKDTKLESILAKSRTNSGTFNVILSPDKSKMLLVTSFPSVKDKKYRVRVKAFETENMTELWTKETDLNFDSKKGDVRTSLIDNTGNAYITGIHNSGKIYEYFLWTYNAATLQWKENIIDTKEKRISEDQQQLIFDALGNAVFCGFLYTGHKENFNSIFYVRVNGQTLSVETNVKMSFGDPALKEKDEIAFTRWKLRGVLSQSNGNILVIGEDEFNSSSKPDPQAAPGSFIYIHQNHSKNIKVLSVKPDGTRNWIRTIRKDQKYTTNDPTSKINSFVYTLIDDRLFVVYNNLSLPQTLTIPAWSWKEPDGASYNYKNFVEKTEYPTFLYIIEPNGNLTYDNLKYGLPLFNFQKGIFYPMKLNTFVFIPLKDGIIMMDESKERYQLGKIHF